VDGKHIVTIEGLQKEKMSPVQQAMIDNAATQCGFCTPGFVMSLTAHSLAPEKSTPEKVVHAISGNICRCTGYQSIKHAAGDIAAILSKKDLKNPLEWLIKEAFIPEYFRKIEGRLREIQQKKPKNKAGRPIGGGTDLYVQQADELVTTDLHFCLQDEDFRHIATEQGICRIGGAVTVTEIMEHPVLQQHFPHLSQQFQLVSSKPIRNMATVAGNIVNASPIADLVIFLLALDTQVVLQDKDKTQRTVPLRKFYTGYKQLMMQPAEKIVEVRFPLPETTSFNFEKVSKRQHLDIASVNSAMLLKVQGDVIQKVHLSAGGVFAWPFYAEKTVAFLMGKKLTPELVFEAAGILLTEIAPISDIRGSKEYKSLLLRQLFVAHFTKMFPQTFTPDVVLSKITA
jgi:xanthine dehydrogenase small subunit